MPKKKSNAQQDVLGQIFDFLFEQAEKKPDKRKPVKLTGLNGDTELANALVAALEKPGAFVTEQAAKDLNDSLEFTLGAIKTDEIGITKVKVNLAKSVDILKDPRGYFEKALAGGKAVREGSKAAFLGASMRELVGNAWARKYADLDTQHAVRAGLAAPLAGNARKNAIEKERYGLQEALAMASNGKGAVTPSELSYMTERSSILLGRKIFGETTWNGLSDDDREKFKKLFTRPLSGTQEILREGLETQFGAVVGRARYAEYVRLAGGKSLSDPEVYRNLENINFDRRIQDLIDVRMGRAAPYMAGMTDAQAERQIETLTKAKLLVNAQDLTAANMSAARVFLAGMINTTKSDLRAAVTPAQKAELRKKLRELRGDQGQLNNMIFWNGVGSLEGTIASWNDIYNGNLLTSILNGNFFDPDQNTLLFRPNGKSASIFDKDVKFFTPLSSDNKLINQYYASGTALYYMTPRSMFRTIFNNGELFGYLLERNRTLIEKKFGRGLTNDQILLLLDPATSAATRTAIYASMGGHSRELEKLLNNIVGNAKLHKFFSLNARLKNKVFGNMNKIYGKWRVALQKFIVNSPYLRKIFKDEAGRLLDQWVMSGGLWTIVRSTIVAALNAIGITTTGGLMNFIITVVSEYAIDFAFQIGKEIFAMLVYVFITIGIVILWGLSSADTFVRETFSYTNEVPGEVLYCPNYTGIDAIIDEPGGPSGPIGEFVGGSLPSGEKCLLGNSANYRCTQGVYGTFSHRNVPAVDITGSEYFYAPTFCGDGNCQVTYVGSVNCTAGYAGGMVIFTAEYGNTTYEFRMIHVNTNLSVGQSLSSGQRVARVMTVQETGTACSTGQHLHIEIHANGVAVNPIDVLTGSSSRGGFECSVSKCP